MIALELILLRLRYRELAPPPSVAGAVECVWILEGRFLPGASETVVPDGCTEMIVQLADRFGRIGENGASDAQPATFLAGPMTRPLRLATPPRVRTVGVRFRPGGVGALTNAPVTELADRDVPLEAVAGPGPAGRIAGQLAEAGGDDEILRAVEHFFAESADRAASPDPGVRRAILEILCRRGNVGMDRLAALSGRSRRSLERRFAAAVGMAPKRLARIVRFQRVFREARKEVTAGWVEVALRCGYADQSHLIRDFRELAGETPTAFLGGEGELSRRFTSRERLERFFAGE
jgi:AraC-like DNA-binding protein